MHPPPPPPRPPSPRRRFKLHLSLSLILLSLLLLLLLYTTLRTPPTQSRPGTFHRDTTPLSSKLHLHRAAHQGAHYHETPANSTTNDLGVEDLYQYALASPRVRNDKDARRLRRYLRSRPSVVEQGKGRRFGRLWGKKEKD